MQESVLIGLRFTLLAGILAGSFALPMKFTTGWRWQHNWSVFAIWALLIMPLIVALLTIPQLKTVYMDADRLTILKIFLFGVAWGVGVVCFGLGLEYLGIALGLSIMLGLMISMGALFPIIIYHPEELSSPKGYDIILGSGIILAGIIICAIAGALRENEGSNYKPSSARANKALFVKGLAIAVLAGILSTMQNIGFVAGNPIKDIAIELGTNPLNAGNATWPILMFGCLVVNLIYCGYLISKYKEWKLFVSQKDGIGEQ